MKTNVIVESNPGAMLLDRLLVPETQRAGLKIIASGPASSAYSKARTHLAVLGEPVALVLDVGSTDPNAVARRRQSAEEVIGHTAGRAPFCLLVAVPSLEALLFTRPGLLSRVFGDRADDDGRAQELGRLSPRAAYKRLDPDGVDGAAFHQLLGALDAEDVAALREESPIRELIAFLHEVGAPAAAAVASPS